MPKKSVLDKKVLQLEQHYSNSIQLVKSLKGKADKRRSPAEKISDWLNSHFGSVWFLVANVIWFTGWISINLGFVPGVAPFDPFPFGLLTMIVSLEAIILSIFVLMSQNRAAKVDDLREELDLEIDIITEQEITKVLELLSKIAHKQGINVKDDQILQEMLQPTDKDKIELAMEQEFADANKSPI